MNPGELYWKTFLAPTPRTRSFSSKILPSDLSKAKTLQLCLGTIEVRLITGVKPSSGIGI